MSNDSRTLALILVIIGFLACGCIVAPLSVAGLLLYRYEGDRNDAELRARSEAMHAASLQDRLTLPNDDLTNTDVTLPTDANASDVNTVPSVSLEEVKPSLPETESPATTLPPPPGISESSPLGSVGSPGGLSGTGAGSLSGGMTETQKKFIYRSARIHRQIVQQMEKQLADQKGRGINTSVLEKIIADTRARQEERLNDLCKSRKITRAELDAILAEGDRAGW